MARQRSAPGRDSTSSERIAGISFFLFVLMQVPAFLTETTATVERVVLLSPLQVSAAHMANNVPGAYPYCQSALIPGAWTRDVLSPYIRCLYKSGMKGPCKVEQQRLTNYNFVLGKTQLPSLQKFIKGPDMKGEATRITYGCALIVVSAAFALVYSVKTAVAGFLLLGWGVIRAGMTPLPPSMMMAFLCLYAGFQLENVVQHSSSGSGSSSGEAARPGVRNPYSKTAGEASKPKAKASKERKRA